DIVVDLPKNDFKYRYGGSFEGCDDKELKLLNNIANDPSNKNNPKDHHYLVANTYSLYKNIATFVSKRWRKNGFDEDGANLRLVLYINQLHRLKEKMDETLGIGFPNVKDKYIELKGTAKLLLETENHVMNHNLRHIYYSMFIYLYQSELVRDLDIKIRPERVKSAKRQCIDASIKQMELLEWYSQNVPNEYNGFPHIAWSLNSLLCLTNFFFIQDPSLKEKHTEYFNRIVSVYKSLEKNSKDYMKLFGISEHDLEPWIIPKYGSFFYSHCCGNASFSTLDIGEYLGEIITSVSVFQNETYTVAYKGFRSSRINEDIQETCLSDGYISQINRTILNHTRGFQIKRSIVIDTGFDIEDFIRVNPLVLIPSSLTENNEVSESNLEPKIYPELQKSPKIIQKQKKCFETKHPKSISKISSFLFLLLSLFIPQQLSLPNVINTISSYEILIKIFVLSQNPEVRFVSREFYEISSLDSVRASFLLKKIGKEQVLKVSKGSFKFFPNLFEKQELVLELLKKGANPDSKSKRDQSSVFKKQARFPLRSRKAAAPEPKQELFCISIRRGWGKVVKNLLNLFTEITKENSLNYVQYKTNGNEIEKAKSQQIDLEYHIPLVNINYTLTTPFELAISHKQADIVKQLLDAHLIEPKLNYDESKTKIYTHPRVNLQGLDQKKLCDLFEQEGLDLLKLFFVNGFNVSSANESIFSEFCKRGSLKFVKFLVENGTGINGDGEYIDKYDSAPLKLAIENHHFEVANYLIERGADTSEYKDLEIVLSSLGCDDSPIRKKIKLSTGKKYALQEASSNGCLNIVKNLVENGANIHENNEIALKEASENGHLDIVEYLVEKEADIHVDQDWVLGMACKSGHFGIVKYLAKKGANIQARENFALGIACRNGRLDIVKYLIENGADLKAEEHWNQIFREKNKHSDVIDYLIERGLDYDNNRKFILGSASLKGRLDIIKVLVENGVDVHANEDFAITRASQKGFLDVVKYLVENGANIHANNDQALRSASRNGHLGVVKYLVENGAGVCANDDQALIWASMNGHLEVVKYLLKNGADIHANNDDALREARINRHTKVVKHLKQVRSNESKGLSKQRKKGGKEMKKYPE
ncbi:hypothetical protein BB559_005537, partial [Furculomyces boomerangus]